jgi:signal transduction histidine kinase
MKVSVKPVRHWSLRAKVIALVLIVVSLLGLLATGAAVTAVRGRGQLDQLLDQIGPMRTGINDLTTAMVNEETGMRGYALRGGEVDLLPYTDGLKKEQTAVDAIRNSSATTAELRAQLATALGLIEQWHSDIADPAVDAVRTNGTAAGQAFLASHTTAQFDSVRAALGRMQATGQQIRDAAVASLRDTNSGLVTVLFVAVGVVAVSGIGMVLLLQQMVTRPVVALAAQVREVAGGNYDREIYSEGPVELERLARDIDGMRRKIASDLAEVRRSRATAQQALARLEEVNVRLEAQAAELTRSNRDLEQFAYVASHDLQEPLRKVMSFCQLLQRRYANQLDERADQYIAFAVNGAQRMQRLINDLLAFSRIGRLTNVFTDVDLNKVMNDVVGQLELPDDAGAVVTWSDLPVVRGEEPLLTNLLTNLVSNSVKFRRPDAPPRVRVSAERTGDHWQISCVDNGIGIETEFAEKVFVIFQRLHPRDAYPGTGIGLAIAKKIVEYHGGQIWVDPSYEGGTAIRFTLAVAPEVSVATERPNIDAQVKEPVA